ncbi:hypothetical protein N8I77_002637 [Diaporthe amygdali]|uniref:NACHT domain-containing protein n=1 Tax=Phomopsis amygdali TaxID=1214568 RepID=A0AAD9WBI4_PHOAM|nr:hypothetical protein N8I77_002637 [Diaporthe amygdali]
MSGLEGLAALGLACSIFQVINFGHETLSLVKDVYHHGTLDESLMEKSLAIQAVASDIVAVNIPQPGKQERKMVDVTKKCTGVARDLQEEIAFLIGHSGKGNLRATLKIAAKANWRKRRLERMEKDLADSEQLMHTTLLAWVFKSLNTACIDIDSLGQDLRNFVIKYRQGCREASQLVSQECLQVREVIVRESAKNEKALRVHVTKTSARFEQKLEKHVEQSRVEQLQNRLLKSLKYPGMNERANLVEDAHVRTFGWLFEDEDDWSDNGKEGSGCSGCEELDDNARNEDDYADEFTDESMDDEPSSEECQEEQLEMVWSSFTDWLKSDLGIYWIMGKPGSGKSTLARFILSDPRTKVALQRWRHGATIASHYFWRPGSRLQRSIKGMLCSLVHQLVISVPDALDYASLNVSGLSQKDHETDWSVPELEKLCMGLIRDCGQPGQPLCLIIDGLDECGPEDSQQVLLALLDRIMLLNVKIIITSRDEPIFEKRFRHEPQLRMQDLTAGDLYSYAKDMLPLGIEDKFHDELVEKAEGVFLWLVLAIQSINRGLTNSDSLTDLYERVRSLPEGLESLYKDMWRRLNDDHELYRKSAALYFKLALAVYDRKLACVSNGFSALDMMLASHPKTHAVFREAPAISAGQLLKECEDFNRRVRVCCAGLLSLSVYEAPKSVTESLGETEAGLLRYGYHSAGFKFIHRSAHDFLVDTVAGQDILRHDGTPPEDIDIRILRARLRAIQLFDLMLRKTGSHELFVDFVDLGGRDLEPYLSDLSRVADARRNASRELFSSCYHSAQDYGANLDDTFLGVLALQASTVIEKILASLSMVEWSQSKTAEAQESYKAISFLWRKCQELDYEANDRVLGFVQPDLNLIDMPYRQVNEQDSALLMEMIWSWLFVDGSPGENFETDCREVLSRTPFSSIGLKDYVRDMACFDDQAAHDLMMEYWKGMPTSLAACTSKVLTVADDGSQIPEINYET